MTRNPLLAAVAVATLTLATCADAPNSSLTGEPPASSETESAPREEGQSPSGNGDSTDEAVDADSATLDLQAMADGLDDDVPPDSGWLKIKTGGDAAPYAQWHETVMPGEALTFTHEDEFALAVDGDVAGPLATEHSWTAPEDPGAHEVVAFDTEGNRQHLSVFVLTPLPDQANAVLEGYRIGTYPRNAPEGLIRLADAEALSMPVSPNFTIGQFICKQQPGHWPKFVLVTEPMLVRIEALLAELKKDSRTGADTFFVMSGFRTPFYNTAIGSARLSRHMYGDAADVFVDVDPQNNVMDDINGDGRVARSDAEFLYDFASQLFTGSDALPAGGIGAYGSNAVHGPFVHVDGRGQVARWGR